MSFTDLDRERGLRTPPQSPYKIDKKPNSAPQAASSPNSSIGVSNGNLRGPSGGVDQSPRRPLSHGHSSPYPPPVSPNQRPKPPGPLAQHSRILQDNTRIDTPRPTLTPSSSIAAAVVVSSSSSSSSSVATSGSGETMSPRSPHSNNGNINGSGNNRILAVNRPGDQERRQVLSPPTSPPQFSPPSSPLNHLQHPHRGFTRVSGEGWINGGAPQSAASGAAPSEDGSSSSNDVVIDMNSQDEHAERVQNGDSNGHATNGMNSAPLSGSIQDQEHDYDLMVRHISQQIFNISSNIAVLERLVPCLGQRHKDTVELRSSLHAVLDGTRDLVKSAHGLIKALAKYHQPTAFAQGNSHNNDNDIGIGFRRPNPSSQAALSAESSAWQRKVLTSRRQTHQRLTKDLTLASKSFQDLQRQALVAERQKVATLRRLSASASLRRWSQRRSDLMDLSQQDIEQGALLVHGDGSGAGSSSNANGGTHERELSVQEEALLREILAMDGEISLQESILLERESEILKIEEGMGQVLEVMKELGTLVVEQRADVDFIHDNVLQSRGRIQQGQQEVLKASEYQRRSREKLCYLILIVSTVGALVMLAFVST
ncbi:hypothetical protein EMPS_01854 [Entomortierella parvispora]|uniref:t-SNARE coiled-coil homology domain-containing protein n=1 Tax=Entomortierella parvispora TaxID=205924 RepID=A0A9P3H4C1_9FUNG|nr:hypothetical protein EMPS_01854 [Entomortierella parvispora]